MKKMKFKFLFSALVSLTLGIALAIPVWAQDTATVPDILPDTAPVFSGDTGQPVAVYTRTNAWFSSNRDELSLQNDFGLAKADAGQAGYDVRSTADLSAGIPASTKIIILPGIGLVGSLGLTQIQEVNALASQTNLNSFVQGGGCLLANLADNVNSDGYLAPGMAGKADDAGSCTGTTITAAGLGHPITLGPDGVAGGGDDLTQDSVDSNKAGSFGGNNFCFNNHGSLSGILPANATTLWTEEGGSQRPILAEYTLGSGRVVVHTRPIEFAWDVPQVMTNMLNNILDFTGCGITTLGIDVKPGSDVNSINLGSGGATPVAILGSASLDVTHLDTGTLALGSSGVKTVGKTAKELCSFDDVSGPAGVPDGFVDLVCHFVTMDIVPESGGTTVKVSGNFLAAFGGGAFEGTDSVNIVPPE